MTRYTATTIRTNELVAVDEPLAVRKAYKAIKKPGKVATMVSEKDIQKLCFIFVLCTKIRIVHCNGFTL